MNAIRAGLYGLIVADALGVPAESRTREDLRRNPITGMVGGGLHQQPAGYWSDDSSMTLCLADSIGKVGYYHTHDIMARFDDWIQNGAYTPGGKKFGVGHTCGWAIDRYRKGVTPALCGSNKMNENGNGSLMRILPMAFVLYGKYGKDITKHKKAMEDIHKISGLTHRHPLAQSACGIYVNIACHILAGEKLMEAICDGVWEALDWYCRHRKYEEVIDFWQRIQAPGFFALETEDTIRSGGYVVESLETAIWCLMNTGSYRECVLRCVNMGYDADSTAAIAGGLAGLYYGYDSIPSEWIKQLARKDVIDNCIAELQRYCNEKSIYKFKHCAEPDMEAWNVRRAFGKMLSVQSSKDNRNTLANYSASYHYRADLPVCNKKCGPDLFCYLQTETLYIYGHGAMWDYDFGESMIKRSTNIKKVIISNGCTSIGNNAFSGHSMLVDIEMPESIARIGYRAFYGCVSLKCITIPFGVTEISDFCFWHCRGLTEVTLPGSITRIRQCAFADCRSLKTVVIPEGVQKIGEDAFSKCIRLNSIILPITLKEIGGNAFFECGNLQNVDIPAGMKVLEDGVFSFCGELRNVTLPSSLVQINQFAFMGCKQLADIVIPDSVSEIEMMAFYEVPHITYFGSAQSNDNWGALSRN